MITLYPLSKADFTIVITGTGRRNRHTLLTLGNYEKDENLDILLSNLLILADFYHVSADYLLCRTELRQHEKNQYMTCI